MADSKVSLMSRLRMPSKVSRLPMAQATPPKAPAIPAPSQITRTQEQPTVALNTSGPSKPSGNGSLQNHGVDKHRVPSPANTSNTPVQMASRPPGKPMFHSSSVVRTPVSNSKQPKSTSNSSAAAGKADTRGTVQLTSVSTPRSSLQQGRQQQQQQGASATSSTPNQTAKPSGILRGPKTVSGSSIRPASMISPSITTPKVEHASPAVKSVKTPSRASSMKLPSRTPTAAGSKMTPPPSASSVQALKTRAKSLKFPTRAKSSPSGAKFVAEKAAEEARLAEERKHPVSTGNNVKTETGCSPLKKVSSATTTQTLPQMTTPSSGKKLQRFGFGRGSKVQDKSSPPRKATAGGQDVSRTSPSANSTSMEMSLLQYDKSPMRKSFEVSSMKTGRPPSESSALMREHTASPVPEPIVQSAPAGTGTYLMHEADSEEPPFTFAAAGKSGSYRVSSREDDSMDDQELNVASPSPADEAPIDPAPNGALELAAGLSDASPTLPHPKPARIFVRNVCGGSSGASGVVGNSGKGLNVTFDTIAPMSLLGPDAQKNALSSMCKLPASAVTNANSARPAARLSSGKGPSESVPYRVGGRRRSGSMEDCILATSPSPPSSPVQGRPRTPSAPVPLADVVKHAESIDNIPSDLSTSPSRMQQSQQSNYFRHSVAMAQRTPSSSLRDSHMKILSGSTPSLSILSTAKQRVRASPSGPYVVLDIDSYRQMQSEIKNLKSLLLQLRRALQYGEVS